MPPAERRLGAHLPLGLGMVKAVDRAGAIGADAIQVFADNPTAWRRRIEPPKELPAFQRRLAELSIAPVAIHASYLVNLAGPDARFHAASIEVLANELRVAPGFRARFVNVHVGSHRGDGVELGTARLADGLCLALAEVDDGPDAAMIVLENSAGGGFGLGVDVAELAGIAEAAAARGLPDARLGFCLDAAHAWGAGIDLAHPERDRRLPRRLRRTDRAEAAGHGPPQRLQVRAWLAPRPSRARRGRRIGAVGLGHLVRHPDLAHATYYLETPGMDEGYDAVNMARARDLLAGRPLADLPPEAMELRGSRARTAPPEDDEA